MTGKSQNLDVNGLASGYFLPSPGSSLPAHTLGLTALQEFANLGSNYIKDAETR